VAGRLQKKVGTEEWIDNKFNNFRRLTLS